MVDVMISDQVPALLQGLLKDTESDALKGSTQSGTLDQDEHCETDAHFW